MNRYEGTKMRKNVIVAILLLGLLAALAGPATGARRKKKRIKPYKSETVTIQAGHPVFHGNSGTVLSATGQEFLQNCALPQSNGVDAWVYAVPKAYTKILAAVEAKATSTSPVPIDMDLYFYDKGCAEVGFANAEAPGGETGVIPKGTSFVLVHPYTGAPVDTFITLKPYKSSF
jgi:hypothetical protein